MQSSTSVATTVRPYVIAVVSTGTATWLRSLLDPLLGNECPFSIFYLSVLLTAWLAGTYPAILSLLLGSVAAALLFVPPTDSLLITGASSLLNAGIYLFVNCVAIGLFASLERQRHNVEKRLKENEQLWASLKQADERKDEFLALLAHELRNPLAPLRSNLLLLEKKSNCPETIEKVKVVCQRQIHQLVRLVDDLLDVSRFLRGNLKLQVERFDLRDAIQVAIEMSDEAMKAKSHRFDTLLPDRPVWIEGDPVRVAQLTENLLSNAAKYTPNSGRIILQLESINDFAVLTINDNGIGFPPHECQRILEPFTQMDTSRTREYGGLGIGLSIVRQLVELHGGTLLPKSRGPGSGSCFSVSLPLAQEATTGQLSGDHDDDKPHLSEFHPTKGAPTDCQLAHSANLGDAQLCGIENVSQQANRDSPVDSILIVEDNMDAASALCELIEMEGYQVRVAHDAIAALKTLEQAVPQVILLDIGLPGIDGYQLAQRIRNRWPHDAIYLIACTGWGAESDQQAAWDAGFDHHMVKPVHFQELMKVICTRPAREKSPKKTSEHAPPESSAVNRNPQEVLS